MGRIETILSDGWSDFRNFINPMIALRAELLGEPIRVRRVEDGRMIDERGPVEDFHGTQSFGHRHPAITQALQEFLASDSANWYPGRVSPYSGTLARRLCERANRASGTAQYGKVFFANSGSGAVEAAIKLARVATRRPRILSLDGAYHGCTMGSCALMKRGMFRDPFEPHLPGAEILPFADVDALAEAIRAGGVGAVVVEPLQLEGGVRELPQDYIAALCELTAQHDVFLVADEIQTGLGRTGRFLASEAWPRRPDAVVLGKHLGGGLVPISAMLTSDAWFERAYSENYASAEAHNTTFGGNALVCVAAHAALDLLTDEVIARNGEMGNRFRQQLANTLAKHALVDEVRGRGLILGVALHASDHPWLSFDHFGVPSLAGEPTTGVLACHRMYKRGFYMFTCGHNWRILRILPRFNIDEATLQRFASILDEEIGALCSLV